MLVLLLSIVLFKMSPFLSKRNGMVAVAVQFSISLDCTVAVGLFQGRFIFLLEPKLKKYVSPFLALCSSLRNTN